MKSSPYSIESGRNEGERYFGALPGSKRSDEDRTDPPHTHPQAGQDRNRTSPTSHVTACRLASSAVLFRYEKQQPDEVERCL